MDPELKSKESNIIENIIEKSPEENPEIILNTNEIELEIVSSTPLEKSFEIIDTTIDSSVINRILNVNEKAKPTPIKIVERQARPQVRMPPLKRKPRPEIKIPPLKRKTWVPPTRKVIVVKPVIQYPPLKLRKTPWQSPYLLRQIKSKLRVTRPKEHNVQKPPKACSLQKRFNYFKSIGPETMILNGSISYASRKFSYVSNGKQGAIINLVALVISHVRPIKFWGSKQLDEIVNYGNLNYRYLLRQLLVKDVTLEFPDPNIKIYIPKRKVKASIGDKSYKGSFKEKSFGKLKNQMLDILDEFHGLVFRCGSQNFSVVLENGCFYLFNCEDTDEKGIPCKKHTGSACVLRFCKEKNSDLLIEYLKKYVQAENCDYKLYSFIVRENSPSEKLKPILPEEISEEHEEIQLNNEFYDTNEKEHRESEFKELICENCLPAFSENYKIESHEHGFVEEPLLEGCAEFISLAALIMLKFNRSSLWDTKIIQEILKLASKISSETDCEDYTLTEVQPVISFGHQTLEIVSENVVFGKIVAKNVDLSLEDGLTFFFKQFDCGVIQGPEIAAVWRESDLFFLFNYSEKSNTLKLHWFKHLKDLCHFYSLNLSMESRKDIFKICKVEIAEFKKKSENWNNFIAIGLEKWILSGTKALESYPVEHPKISGQDVCTSIIAIGKNRVLDVQKWTSENIDFLLLYGQQFFISSTSHPKFSNENSEEKVLEYKDIGKIYNFYSDNVDFVYEDEYIKGIVNLEETKGEKINDLEMGLTEFFEVEESGIVTISGISVAVWRAEDHFYLFDCHGRDEVGCNLKFIDNTTSCTMFPGFACLLRFTHFADLSNHILSLVELTEGLEFSITRVECTLHMIERPRLYNYTLFGEKEYSAILRTLNNMHEDHVIFRASMPQKTFCNLMTALSFTKIFNPRLWNHTDINDILKFGYKLLCSITRKLDSNNPLPFDLLSAIQISTFVMKLGLEREEIGYFYTKKFPLSHLVAEEEVQKNEMIIQTMSDGNAVLSQTNISQTNSKTSATSNTSDVILEEFEHPSLPDILKVWEDSDEVNALLVSDILSVALWKQDNFYYIFDPKASNETGKLSKSRIRIFAEIFRKMRKYSAEEKMRRITMKSQIDVRESETEIKTSTGNIVRFTTPKASILELTNKVRLESRDFVEYEDESAYVAWFTTVELLIKHVLKKIPERFGSEMYHIYYFNIEKEPMKIVEIESLANFSQVSERHWILRASLSQNDPQFSLASRNMQDSANCIMSLIFTQLHNPHEWKRCVLDIILKYGDRLYKKSLSKFPKCADVKNFKISLGELDFPVVLGKFVVSLSHEILKKDKLLHMDLDDPKIKFKETLEEFFNDPESLGILMSRNYYAAIWKHEDNYCMFDPHDIGPDGLRKFKGVACLQKFQDITSLIDVFCVNIEGLEGHKNYELHKVQIVKTLISDLKEEHGAGDSAHKRMSSDSNYSFFRGTFDIKVIRGKQVPPIISLNSGDPAIYYAVSALCVQSTVNLVFFTRDTVDMIMNFGKNLYENRETYDLPEVQFSEGSSPPNQVTWNFVLNRSRYTILLDKFKQGFIKPPKSKSNSTSLKSILEDFFHFHSTGILITRAFVSPIWEENGKFVIFYSKPIDANGKFWDSRNSFPGVCAFDELDDLYWSIFGNVSREDYESTFEIRVCQMEQKIISTITITSSTTISDNQSVVVTPAVMEIDEESSIDGTSIDLELECKDEVETATFGNLRFNSDAEVHAKTCCLVALGMNSQRKMCSWNNDSLDYVIKMGNNLFMQLAIENGAEINKFTFLLNKEEFQVKLVPQIEVDREGLTENCLDCVLQEVFRTTSEAIIDDSLVILENDSNYHIFNPLELQLTSDYQATMRKYSNFKTFVRQLLEILNSNPLVADNTIKISAAFVDFKVFNS